MVIILTLITYSIKINNNSGKAILIHAKKKPKCY
nr:MAG TPA: hypothetical protein [Caudoviricetes sp.]